MNKLLLTSVLALAFALPLSSYAGVNALGVHLPIEQAEVSEKAAGGYVSKDFGDTFNVQKLNDTNKSITSEEGNEKYVVFGVDLNKINNS